MNYTKKVISFLVSMALLFTPFNTSLHSYANSNEFENVSIYDIENSNEIEDIVSSIENEFHEKYGDVDEFQIVNESDIIKTEVNGSRGIIRITSYENGEIKEISDINFIENLQEVEKEEIEAISSLSRSKRSATVLSKTTTGGIDPFSIYVETSGDYKSDFKISVTGWNGFSNSYYKNKSWKSGDTENFYNAIIDGADNIDDIKSNARNAAAYFSIKSILKKYIKPGAIIPGYEELRAAMDALGLGFSTEEVVRNSIAYAINVQQCQYYLNRLF